MSGGFPMSPAFSPDSFFLSRAGSKVAAFIKTNVVTYEDNTALFKFAESEFGGVDVRHSLPPPPEIA